MNNLSKKSERFLESLHLYLISSGKKETEANEVVDELRDHLTQAEKEGKDVEDIVGQSPREYFEQVSKEMPFDFRSLLGIFSVLLFGTLSYLLLVDIVNGGAEVSVTQMIGYPSLVVVYLFALTALFRHLARYQYDKKKENTWIAIFASFQLILFIGIVWIDQSIASPTIVFNTVGNICALLFITVFLIIISLWAKTWMAIGTILIMVIPELLVQVLSLNESTALVTKSILIFGGLFLYFWLIIRNEESHATP